MNNIVLGNYTFTDDDILSGDVVLEHSAIGETLSVDAMTLNVHSTHTGNRGLYTSLLEWYTTNSNQHFALGDTNILDIPYATPAYYYTGSHSVPTYSNFLQTQKTYQSNIHVAWNNWKFVTSAEIDIIDVNGEKHAVLKAGTEVTVNLPAPATAENTEPLFSGRYINISATRTQLNGIYYYECEGYDFQFVNYELIQPVGTLTRTQKLTFNTKGITGFTTETYGLQNKFFLSKITQISKEIFKIECVSAIGLLTTSTHYGGIYTGQTASTVLADILDGITYELDALFTNVPIRGYLPIETKRDALQQVLFAMGASVKIKNDGTLQIVPASNVSTGDISVERTYQNGEYEIQEAVDGVKLTEHNYFINGEEETLFEDTITGRQVITFSEPHYNITAVDGNDNDILVYPTSSTQGVNHCIVEPIVGVVSSGCTIKGKKYTHIERVVTAGTVTTTGDENIMSVTQAYLANPTIADELVDRIWEYAQCNKYIKQYIVVGDEHAGDVVNVISPYNYETKQGLITEMNITMSGKIKAKTKFLLDYTPSGAVTGFENYTIITSNTTWEKNGNYVYVNGVALKDEDDNPIQVDKIRIICIGGGNGGSGGFDGTAGTSGSWSQAGSSISSSDITSNYLTGGIGGSGGVAGKEGKGGKVFEISLDLVSGDSGNITIGQGGTGGTKNDETIATNGTETSFTKGNATYTSLNGRSYAFGYTEVLSGRTFATTGKSALDGGNGGDGGIRFNGDANTLCNGGKGDNVGDFIGGNGVVASRIEMGERGHSGWEYRYLSGCGGGGASGTANGSDAVYNGRYGEIAGAGANGGSGANATEYGGGGGAGNGGGGGGGGSGWWGWYQIWSLQRWNWWYSYINFNGASGGTGGNGGNGSQGCLIIYY